MIRRWLVILLVPALLVAAGIIDSSTRGPRAAAPVTTFATGGSGGSSFKTLSAPDITEADQLGPVAAPPDALDSTWFCAGGSSNQGGVADASVTIANGGTRDGRATLTVFSGDGKQAATTVSVAARSESVVPLSTVLRADTVAAKVDVTGGGIAVTQRVSSSLGSSTQPCATAPSNSWYFASGTTARGAAEELYLFNPFPDDATANITLQTDAGLRQPPAFQGVIVKAGSLQVLDVASVENRRGQIAATVNVTTGRIVAARQQRFDGTGDPGPSGSPPVGVDASPGTPRATGAVVFPFAYKGSTYGETLFVYNPGSAAASVAVSIALDDPQKNGTMPDQPLQLAPGAVATVDLSSLQPLPADVVHSIAVHSTNGVPVTAELWEERSGSTGAGLAITAGAPVLATGWFLPGVVLAQSASFVDVFNPGAAPVILHATLLAGAAAGPVPHLDGATVPAGGRLRVALPEADLKQARASIVLQASVPVAVAWDSTSTGAHGSNLTVGVPLSGTTSLP